MPCPSVPGKGQMRQNGQSGQIATKPDKMQQCPLCPSPGTDGHTEKRASATIFKSLIFKSPHRQISKSIFRTIFLKTIFALL